MSILQNVIFFNGENHAVIVAYSFGNSNKLTEYLNNKLSK